MKIPSMQEIESLKAQWPTGTLVRLIAMDDASPRAPKPGEIGTVDFIDDIGDIHVIWNSRSRLALIPGVDSFEKVEEI